MTHHHLHRSSALRAGALVLVTAGTGTTGQRVANRLEARGVAVRRASRSGTPPFDWDRPATWPEVLDGVTAVYVAYSPDLAMPGAVDTVDSFCQLARRSGVEQFVLLAGRGEPEAEAAEDVVRASGARSTIVRASWFAQNFSEGMLRDSVLAGEIALPAGRVREPFVDVEDVADVAVAALTEAGHDGRIYDVTGPRLMTFAAAARELEAATGRNVRYVDVDAPHFIAAIVRHGVPAPVAEALAAMFAGILDGRNSYIGDGVQQALSRAPRDFAEFVRTAAADGAWDTPARASGSVVSASAGAPTSSPVGAT